MKFPILTLFVLFGVHEARAENLVCGITQSTDPVQTAEVSANGYATLSIPTHKSRIHCL